jgi:hypothetical protein
MNETAAGSAQLALPEQEISRDTLIEKYAKGKETSITEVRRRVAPNGKNASCRPRKTVSSPPGASTPPPACNSRQH